MSGSSMYERAMGADYARLHPAVQRFHRLSGSRQLQGTAECGSPAHWLGRVLAWALRAPRRAAAGALRFELDAAPLQERWIRHFPAGTMHSRLQLQDGRIVERLGAATLYFRLAEQRGMLVMRLEHMRFLNLPCPAWLLPRVTALEYGEGEQRFCFHVEASLPGLGSVVSYRGHLDLVASAGSGHANDRVRVITAAKACPSPPPASSPASP